MKQEDKRYEEWLTEIRNRQPMVGNPNELTANILQQITRISNGKKRKRWLIGSWISGVAAGVVLCLLISETIFSSVPPDVRTEENVYFQPNKASSLPENWKEMNLSEKSDYLSNQYIQHKEQKQTRIVKLMNQLP